MKSIGKHSVTIRSFCDGVLNNTIISNRVVYQNKLGNYYINDLGNKKQISMNKQGFVAEFYAKSIKSYSITDIMSTLQQKFGLK